MDSATNLSALVVDFAGEMTSVAGVPTERLTSNREEVGGRVRDGEEQPRELDILRVG